MSQALHFVISASVDPPIPSQRQGPIIMWEPTSYWHIFLSWSQLELNWPIKPLLSKNIGRKSRAQCDFTGARRELNVRLEVDQTNTVLYKQNQHQQPHFSTSVHQTSNLRPSQYHEQQNVHRNLRTNPYRADVGNNLLPNARRPQPRLLLLHCSPPHGISNTSNASAIPENVFLSLCARLPTSSYPGKSFLFLIHGSRGKDWRTAKILSIRDTFSNRKY